jgi:hypothetical protein
VESQSLTEEAGDLPIRAPLAPQFADQLAMMSKFRTGWLGWKIDEI